MTFFIQLQKDLKYGAVSEGGTSTWTLFSEAPLNKYIRQRQVKKISFILKKQKLGSSKIA